jgi:nuclear pore complex protein Nup188
VGSLSETLEMTAAGLGKAPDTPWLFNEDAIRNLHEILMAAAPSAYITAGPALLGWSVILKQIRSRVSNRREAQNRRNDGFDDDTEQGSAGAPGAGALILAPDAYEGLLEDIMDSTEDDPIDFLALSAVNECRVFETLADICQKLGDTLAACFTPELGLRLRMSILELMRASAPDIGYRTETFEVVLSAAHAGQEYWDLIDARGAREDNNPVKYLLSDPLSFQTFWQNAKYRYPFESAPFLRFSHALATLCVVEGGELKTILNFLEPFRTFTYPLPFKYEHYVTTQEEDNNNTIRLTRDLPLFEPRWRGANANLLSGGQEMVLATASGDLTIRSGTTGRMVVENEPKVVYFFHHYNGVKYLGKLLETFLVAGDTLDATTGSEAEPEAVAEIIGTFAVVLHSIANSGRAAADIQATANRFFETASSALGRGRDITLVISEVFEQELQRQSNETTSDASLEILTSCIQYLHALLQFSPGRVWPLIGRSGLLGFDRGAGKLSSIVGNVEVILGKYPFLIACTRLFEALVNDFTVNAIARKRKANTVRRRFSDVEEHNVRVPDQVLSKVLLSFTRYLTEVLESSTTWRFVDQDERLQLTKSIMLSFDRMLVFAFGIQGVQEPGPKPLSEKVDAEQDPDSGDDTKTSTKSAVQVNAALTQAATYIVESFLSKSSGPLRFKPILRSLYDGFNTPASTIYLNRQRLVADDVKAALEFSKRLLRVGVMLERTSHLEAQLFAAAPLIARLYAVNDSYRNPIIKLFEALIISASGSVSEPPSLLGYLGAKTSKNFLHTVSHLDKPLSRSENIGAIWHFLSMVMSSRQQWFANYVLTGKTPRDALKDKKPIRTRNTSSPKPLLNTAIDNLSHIGDIPDTEALVMLEFVALAQNFWPWTMHDLESNTSFIIYLTRYIESLGPNQTTSSRNPAIKACHRTRIAAYIAEILAMHIFHSRQTGKPSIVKDIMPKLAYYVNSATTAPSYNASLHGNLRQNFDSRYAACTLQSFRRTNLVDRQFGDNYFYDLELLDRMLHADEAWMGRRNNGYKVELASANVNMSLVDAQVVSRPPIIVPKS